MSERSRAQLAALILDVADELGYVASNIDALHALVHALVRSAPPDDDVARCLGNAISQLLAREQVAAVTMLDYAVGHHLAERQGVSLPRSCATRCWDAVVAEIARGRLC